MQVLELAAECKYYCLSGLSEMTGRWLAASDAVEEEGKVNRIPIISTAKEERLLLAQTSR